MHDYLTELMSIDVRNKLQRGAGHRDYDFHWFTINSPNGIEKGRFDGSKIKNSESLMKLFDPKKTNATAIGPQKTTTKAK